MTQLRIAHFSDTHVLSLKGVGVREFLNKRMTGAVNLAFNRAKHYRVEVFEQLLDAVLAVNPDHSVCTGDLVNLALEPEFIRVRELLTDRFDSTQLTLVPGNHDYYTKGAVQEGLFEHYFQEYLPQDLEATPTPTSPYPITRNLGDVVIVGLSSAIPTPSFMATGEIGDEQRNQLQTLLTHPASKNAFKLLMLHHPLFAEPTRRFDHARRLKDAEGLINTIDVADDHPDLVIHGHNHEFKRQALPNTQVPVVQVGSASRAGKKRAEFHIYVIEDQILVRVERHIHQPETGLFIPHSEDGTPLSA
jgi:3',5'-cyclic AMP phosphodiesterase CpdA